MAQLVSYPDPTPSAEGSGGGVSWAERNLPFFHVKVALRPTRVGYGHQTYTRENCKHAGGRCGKGSGWIRLVYEAIDKNGGGSVKDFTTFGSVLCW